MSNERDIGIVGMSGRFPGARTLDEFWRNPAGGLEAAPALEESGHFDAAFFGLSRCEAATMDPQHRLLLELVHEALEHAGCDPDRYRGRVGVFTASSFNTHLTSNDKDSLSTRISRNLNRDGPHITVQTACSTSMVAIHLACESLLSHETDLVLAGAVSVRVPQRAGHVDDGGVVVSPDAHVRAIDAAANGTVSGSGGGVLVLKRLADALADGDTVHALIKGPAVNDDGPGTAGDATRCVAGQADAAMETLTNAGVDAAAARVTGIIKTVLALKHRQRPSAHVMPPNTKIDLSGTNAHIILEEAPDPGSAAVADAAGAPRLLVLSAKTETALDQATHQLREFLGRDDSPDLGDVAYTLQIGRKAFPHRRCVVCAGREDAVAALARADTKRVFSGQPGEAKRPLILLLPGVGDQYVGMAHELYETWPVFKLEVDRCSRLLERYLGVDIRSVIYPANTRWKTNEERGKGIDLKKMLGHGGAPEDEDVRNLNRTLFVQPALFTIEYSTARLWQSLGITPDAIVGHSMGEYVAACLAGVMSLEDALALIATRAKLVSELPQGAMLAVTLSEAELRPGLPGELSISLINGPRLCVVAGPAAAVARFEATLSARGVISRRVQNAHAFHSHMLDPIVQALENQAKKARLGEPAIPYISNVTGTWITPAEATDPKYWAKHANHTARFDDALRELWRRFKNPILLEVGPGRTLGMLAMQHPDRRGAPDPVAIASIRHHYERGIDSERLWEGIGRLWLAGAAIQWENGHPGGRRRVPLPTYPFERHRERPRVPEPVPEQQGAARKNPDSAERFYVPS